MNMPVTNGRWTVLILIVDSWVVPIIYVIMDILRRWWFIVFADDQVAPLRRGMKYGMQN